MSSGRARFGARSRRPRRDLSRQNGAHRRRSGRTGAGRLLECSVVIDSSAIDEERQRFAETLEAVGPDAPTNAGAWTAHDVAAHVVSLDRLAGVPTYFGRLLVGRGVRLNDLVRRRPQLSERALNAEKRRGFDATIAHLREPSPSLLLRPSVRAVGLFEVWAHHEDVRRPNGLPRDDHPDLDEVIAGCAATHALTLCRTKHRTTSPTGSPVAKEALDRCETPFGRARLAFRADVMKKRSAASA
ncbi:MAG: maleylpyruvate isomerase family mycothiol-dependent enzyme [Acidimicrobiales bacterium]